MEKEFIEKTVRALDRAFADLRYDIIAHAKMTAEINNNKIIKSCYDKKSQEKLDFINKVHKSCLQTVLDLVKEKEIR